MHRCIQPQPDLKQLLQPIVQDVVPSLVPTLPQLGCVRPRLRLDLALHRFLEAGAPLETGVPFVDLSNESIGQKIAVLVDVVLRRITRLERRKRESQSKRAVRAEYLVG